MRTFEQYINEARQKYIFGGTDDRNTFVYNYAPKDGKELAKIIKKLIIERGEDGDFNDIDTSKVTDMDYMFSNARNFNGDISGWDTSNATIMYCMFRFAESFNKDISVWDTSNVTDMSQMFHTAESFNQDISGWDVSKVTNNAYMFENCPIKEEYKPKFKK